jgi:hypothetical protein
MGEENDIANPHRTSDEMSIWAQETVADIMSFASGDYNGKLAQYRRYFTPEGWELYSNYLRDAKLLNIVSEQGYSIGTIVDSVPEIVNQGTSGGVYHWILKMPITISFFNADNVGNIKTGASGKYILYIDVMRIPETNSGENIAINNWRVDDARVRKQ